MRDEIINKAWSSSTGYRIYYDQLQEYEFYLPRCTPDGLFERVQCSTINSSAPTQSSSTPHPQCWCVDPVTGISDTVSFSIYLSRLYPAFGGWNNSVCSDALLNTTALCEVCNIHNH